MKIKDPSLPKEVALCNSLFIQLHRYTRKLMNKNTLIYWNNNTSARSPISFVFVLTRMFFDYFKLLRDFKAGQKCYRTQYRRLKYPISQITYTLRRVIYSIRFYGVEIVSAINVPGKLSVINLQMCVADVEETIESSLIQITRVY